MRLKLISASLLFLSSNLLADPITISNPDLNAQVLADGAFTHSIQGWAVINGYAGVYNPPESVLTGEAGDGYHTNTLYMNGHSIVAQTLTTNLTSNTDYTLTFDVGDRLDTNFPSYIVRIKAAGNTIFTAIDPIIPNGGSFSTVTLNFSTGDSSYAGNPMVIELEATGNTGQVNFDNFTLSSAAGTPSSGSKFGDWNHPMIGGTTYSIDTPYLAETDAIITFVNSGDCQGNTYALKVGDTSATSALLTRVDHIGGMSAPVKKGQYWQVDQTRYSSSCSIYIGFLPFLP
ncbi:hypothetical protein KIH87_03930 [Paraneptunicella aestuarii]|uniref:hypothetical protein n=1 Tax=Paraneptunicella aestuarii TaxID=2831148 RepID=UPI001E38F100|nr:hypothetical protein [Paraneptunicella aestuarii]UAA39515.1 hypothetical protein KIH87_03930 [Paraneptunicella aestuarii]